LVTELKTHPVDATGNPFAVLVGGKETTSQEVEKQTEKPKRKAKSGKGRGSGFLSLQGSPTDTPQMQDE